MGRGESLMVDNVGSEVGGCEGWLCERIFDKC